MSQAQITQTQETYLDRLVKEIDEKIDRILEIEEKKNKVRGVFKELTGKDCEVKINYETGEVWCIEAIWRADILEKVFSYLKTRKAPWLPLFIITTTHKIEKLDPEIIDYVDTERLKALFGEYYGIHIEEDNEYRIYIPLLEKEGIHVYLGITVSGEAD